MLSTKIYKKIEQHFIVHHSSPRITFQRQVEATNLGVNRYLLDEVMQNRFYYYDFRPFIKTALPIRTED